MALSDPGFSKLLDSDAISLVYDIESQQRALETAKQVLITYLKKREGLDESWTLGPDRKQFVQVNGKNGEEKAGVA